MADAPSREPFFQSLSAVASEAFVYGFRHEELSQPYLPVSCPGAGYAFGLGRLCTEDQFKRTAQLIVCARFLLGPLFVVNTGSWKQQKHSY